MDAMEAILSRRSIRRYTSQKVSDHLVKELLEAAMSAPSANNEQPWHFIIINDRKIMEEIPKFHPYSSMLREASLAILVCVDLNFGTEGFLVQDGSAATQNLLVAAHAKGLGAVWLGVYPLKERINGMRKLLGIPERILPLSLISIGYPAEIISRVEPHGLKPMAPPHASSGGTLRSIPHYAPPELRRVPSPHSSTV